MTEARYFNKEEIKYIYKFYWSILITNTTMQ